MARSKGSGGKPKVGKLTGKRAKGRQGGNIKGGVGEPVVVPQNPSLSGNADVVRERSAQAAQGAMQSKQLRANKSKGLVPRKGGRGR